MHCYQASDFSLASSEQLLDYSFHSLVKLTAEQKVCELTLHISKFIGNCLSFWGQHFKLEI